MAKNPFDNIKNKLEKALKEATNRKNLGALGIDIIKQIKKRTTTGKGVIPTGQTFKLPPLSDSYKAVRKGKVEFFTDKKGKLRAVSTNKSRAKNLSEDTRPGKANNIATGQLLGSIRLKIIQSKIIIYLLPQRSKTLTGRGRDNKTNQEVNKHLEKMNRDWFNLANFEKKIFARQIKDTVIKLIKKG